MSKNTLKNQQTKNDSDATLFHDEQIQALAQEVAEHDDVEIVAEVDIDNKAVTEVLIIRDTDTGDEQNDIQQENDNVNDDDTNDSKQADALDTLTQKADDLQTQAADTLDQVKTVAAQQAEQAVQVASDTKTQLAGQLDDVKTQVADKLDTAQTVMVDRAGEIKEQTKVIQQEMGEKIDTLKTNAQQVVQDLKNQTSSKVETLTQNIGEKIETIKQVAGDKVGQVKAQLGQVVDTSSDKNQDYQNAESDQKEGEQQDDQGSANALKEKIGDKLNQIIEQGKSVLDDTAQALDDKYAASERLSQISENAQLVGQTIKDEAQALQLNAQQSLQAAKRAGAEYEATHEHQGITAKLGKLGAYLSGMYGVGKDGNKQYQAVDISQDDFEKDAFHAQGSYLTGKMLGSKAKTVQKVANKVVPQSKFEAVGEAIYNKVAQWSHSWAIKDLQKDERFAALDTLSADEKEAFANDIANQNRALAALGGVTGLIGLKGLLADMAWLLMVSLRTVYQLAEIYDKPLSGTEGIKKAYGVLSGANLDKLQEKQVVLTALALGSTMLANAQTTGVKAQLDSLSARYRESQPYAKQFVDLDKFIDLDKFNPSWLNKLLPLTSVAAATHYNNELIDEVIGTAIASFSDHNNQKLMQIEQKKQNTIKVQ